MLSGEEPCQVSINVSIGLTMDDDGSLAMNVAKHPAEQTQNICSYQPQMPRFIQIELFATVVNGADLTVLYCRYYS